MMADILDPLSEFSRAVRGKTVRERSVADAEIIPPPPRFYGLRAGVWIMVAGWVERATSSGVKIGLVVLVASMLIAAVAAMASGIGNNGLANAQEIALQESASSTGYSFNLAENTDGSTTAVSVGTVTLADPCPQNCRYWLRGDYMRFNSSGIAESDNKFEIDQATGAITYVGSGENYEGINTFNLAAYRWTYDGSGYGAAIADVTVNVTNVAEAPKFVPHRVVSSTDTFDFALENNTDGSSTAVKIGTARVDDKDSDTLIFAITAGNTGSKFSIGSSTGEITYTGSGETSGTFALTITVKDSSSDTTPDDTATVNITVATAATDRTALKAFYNALTGDSWWRGKKNGNTEPWKIDDDTSSMGDWHGVTVDSDGRVTELVMATNNLSGTLPYQLGNLTKLQKLDLTDDRKVTGGLPASLGNLTSLQKISMQYIYKLSGAIPEEFGNLSSLQELDLLGTDVSGTIPKTLGNLTSLQTLSFEGTELKGTVPSELGKLTNLTYLGLGEFEITGPIPAWVVKLTKLKTLNLNSAHYTGKLPEKLGDLTDLQVVRLQNNRSSWNCTWWTWVSNETTQCDAPPHGMTGYLPTSMVNIPTSSTSSGENLRFLWFNQSNSLCAPKYAAFKTWMNGILNTSGPYCSYTISTPNANADACSTHRYADTDAHSHGYTDIHAYTHTHADGYTYAHHHTDIHGYAHADSRSQRSDCDTHADA